MDENRVEDSVREYYKDRMDEMEEFTDNMVKDSSNDETGDTINVGAMLNKLRQKAKEVGSASVKKAAEAVEEFKAKAQEEKEIKNVKEVEEQIEEISIDIDDIKQEIFDCVKKAMDAADIDGCVQSAIEKNGAAINDEELKNTQKSLSDVTDGLDYVKQRLSAMQQSNDQGFELESKKAEKVSKDISELKAKIDDVSAAIGGISKLSDSVFDLKNAQANMKTSIDSLNTSVKKLKKRVTAGVAILSIISIIVALLQVIALLS